MKPDWHPGRAVGGIIVTFDRTLVKIVFGAVDDVQVGFIPQVLAGRNRSFRAEARWPETAT